MGGGQMRHDGETLQAWMAAPTTGPLTCGANWRGQPPYRLFEPGKDSDASIVPFHDLVHASSTVHRATGLYDKRALGFVREGIGLPQGFEVQVAHLDIGSVVEVDQFGESGVKSGILS